MPRRLPLRPGKLLGNVFVLLVITVMTFIYVEVNRVWGPRLMENPWVLFMLVAFNMLFVMLVWSFT